MSSPLKRSIRAPLSPAKGGYSPGKYERRRASSKSALYEDVLSGPFLLNDSLATKSKRRSEKIARSCIPESEALEELQRQLQLKDQFMESLKDRFLELRVSAKFSESESPHNRERLVQQLCREKVELAKSVQRLEQENQQLRTAPVEEPVTNVDQVAEQLQEEVEALRSQVTAKETLLVNMKADLAQLSEIVHGMTTLNTELNDKIIRLNNDMEETNRTAYEAQAKAQHIEETEKALVEVTAEKLKQDGQLQKLREGLGRMQDLQEAAAELKTFLGTVQLQEGDSEKVRTILARMQAGGNVRQVDSMALKARVKELEGELRTVARELSKSKANESAWKGRVSAFEEEHRHWKQSLASSVDQLKQTVSLLQSNLKGLSTRYDKLSKDYEKTHSEAQRSSFRLVLLQAKLEKATAAAALAAKAESKATAQLKDAQSLLVVLKSTKSSLEASLLLRDQKAKEDAARLKVLTEELWKKDTQILKKSSEMCRLQEQFSSQKLTLHQSFSREKAHEKLSPLKPYGSRSHSVANPLKLQSNNAIRAKPRPHQSHSLVFTKRVVDSTNERPMYLLETLARAITTTTVVNNAGTAAPESLRSLLGHTDPDADVKQELIEKMWNIVNELEDLVHDAKEPVPVAWVKERTRATLGLTEKEAYMPSELLSSLKSIVRATEQNTLVLS